MAAVLAVSAQSVISLAFAFMLSMLLGQACFGRGELGRCAAAFLVYAVIALCLYHLHLSAFPEYVGFSGPPGQGTDDSYYYSLAAPEVPGELPTRPNFQFHIQAYSTLLKLFAIPAHAVYGSVHPLDLIFVNVAIFALLPSATSRFALALGATAQAARAAWWLVLACPFLIANGVVLLRDGIVAVTSVLAMSALLERRHLLLLISLVATAYIRPEHAVLVIGTLWVMYWVRFSADKTGSIFDRYRSGFFWVPMLLLPCLLLAALLVLVPFDKLPEATIANLLLRTDFLETFIVLNSGGESSIFYQINHLPWFARLPLAVGFYFLSPLSDIPSLANATVLIARDYLYSAFGLLMIVYAGLFCRGALHAFAERNRLLIALIALYLFELLVISQASMQIRHKVPLVPMFYVIVAVGISYRTPVARFAAVSVAAGVGSVQLLLAGWRLAGH